MHSNASHAMEKWTLQTILPRLRKADVPPVPCPENKNPLVIYHICKQIAIKESELAWQKLFQSELQTLKCIVYRAFYHKGNCILPKYLIGVAFMEVVEIPALWDKQIFLYMYIYICIFLFYIYNYIPGSSKCVRFVPFHPQKPTKRQKPYIFERSIYSISVYLI